MGEFTVLAVDGLIFHAQLATATFAVRCHICHNQPCYFCAPSLMYRACSPEWRRYHWRCSLQKNGGMTHSLLVRSTREATNRRH
jgi:hypothetical protein